MVYITLGILSLLAASKAGRGTTNNQGAVFALFQMPFGRVLVALVAVGLAGYALWRWIETILDPENTGNGAKGIAMRLGFFVSGCIYASLSFGAFKLVMGGMDQPGHDPTQDWTSRLILAPFGRWLVGIAGGVMVGVGLWQFIQSYTTDFCKTLQFGSRSEAVQGAAIALGRVGLAARGVVFGMIGLFLLQAAVQANAHRAKGVRGVLDALSQQPYGAWCLGLVAAGLVAYGLYMIVEAKYRRFRI